MERRPMYRITVYPRTRDEPEARAIVTTGRGQILAEAKSHVSTDVAVLLALGEARDGLDRTLREACLRIDPNCLVAKREARL